MALSNAEKSKHGANAQNNLEHILQLHVKNGYIVKYEKDFRIGKSGYTNDEQFYAPFIIEFKDGQRWILYSTTSMRTDRIKGEQWDAYNIMDIDETVVKALLIYPDGVTEKEKKAFIKQNDKYANSFEYSAIEAVISQDALSNAIETEALSDMEIGAVKDIQGKQFEVRIASILSSADNIHKWKTNDPTAVGYHYSMFETIVNALGLVNYQVTAISAKTGSEEQLKLPSGGNPKTDILITVEANGETEHYSLSCKRSSEATVAVHQYNADTFSRVLNPSDENLKKWLHEFQKHGSMKHMGADACSELEKALKPYVRKLVLWVLGGIGGDGDPKIHWATHLLTYSNNTSSISIHSIDEYCDILLSAGINGTFGTPFSWTYPSKRRGKDIKLKCKII